MSETQVPFRYFLIHATGAMFFFFSFSKGFYDVQYADRVVPDCRGRLVADKDGKYWYRAVVPISYPIPVDVSLLCLVASVAPAFGVLNWALYPRAPSLRGVLTLLETISARRLTSFWHSDDTTYVQATCI